MRIGFVGAGLMGAPMVERLVSAGYEVVISSRTPERLPAEWTTVNDPGLSAEAADIVCSIVPDSAEVRSVVEAVLATAKPGTVLIEMSTHSPDVARELAEQASGQGVAYLDSPAAGGVAAVRRGVLGLWVGGSSEAFEFARPVLSTIGDPDRLRHCGPVGAGLVVKLVNNYLVAVNAVASGEALAMAREAGVDPQVVVDAIASSGGGANAQLTNLYPNRVFHGDFVPGFKLGHMLKDLGHAVDLAGRSGIKPTAGQAAREQIESAGSAYGGEVDFGSVARLYGW